MFKNFKELKKKVALFISLISIFVIALITKNISYGINVEEKNKKMISPVKEVIVDFNLNNINNLSDNKISVKEFKPDENLKKINNYSEINLNISDKLDMSFNNKGELIFFEVKDDFVSKLMSENNKKFSEEDEKKLIEKIEKKYIGKDYVMIGTGELYEGVKMISYAKKLKEGGIDKFNGANFLINKRNSGEILSFAKLDRKIVNREVKLSEKDIEKIFLKNYPEYKKEKLNIKLETAYYIKEDTKEITEIPELVYSIALKSEKIFLSPETGEILGRDFQKGTSASGIAIGSPYINHTHQSTILASNKMGNKLNYAMYGPQIQQNLKSEILTAIYKNGFRGLYVNAHGNIEEMSATNQINDPYTIRYSDIPSTVRLRFVFLNACNTGASDSKWPKAFGITKSPYRRAFLGWGVSIDSTVAYNYCKKFWNDYRLGSIPIFSVMYAASRSENDCGIRFFGDYLYNGKGIL